MFATMLPLILQIVTWIVARSNFSNDTKKQYFKFIEAMIADESSSATLRTKAMTQRERILEKIKSEGDNA